MILKASDYANLLDDILLTSTDVEKSITEFKLTFDSYKNEDVEWKIKLPMFVESFYSFILQHQSIPNQSELFDLYINQPPIQEILDNTKGSKDIFKGIRARLFRTYPSLIRDLHFSLFLKERVKNNAHVIYNIQLDVEVGIDILIEQNGTLYALNLFTPTVRARLSRVKKGNRHVIVSNAIQIELPVEFKTERKFGDFFLYGENELNQLKQLIKLKIQER